MRAGLDEAEGSVRMNLGNFAGLHEKLAAALITVAAFVLFGYYSVVTPIFEASDELWHYPMVLRLATGGGLPEQRAGQTDEEAPWRQEGSQPPLYYAAAALVSAPIDQSNWRELRRINPHGLRRVGVDRSHPVERDARILRVEFAPDGAAPVADRDEQDHRRDPDDDSEHGKEEPQLRGGQRTISDLYRVGKFHTRTVEGQQSRDYLRLILL